MHVENVRKRRITGVRILLILMLGLLLDTER
jgi:hypothetical protein